MKFCVWTDEVGSVGFKLQIGESREAAEERYAEYNEERFDRIGARNGDDPTRQIECERLCWTSLSQTSSL